MFFTGMLCRWTNWGCFWNHKMEHVCEIRVNQQKSDICSYLHPHYLCHWGNRANHYSPLHVLESLFILLNSDLSKQKSECNHSSLVSCAYDTNVALNITHECGCLEFVGCIEFEEFENQTLHRTVDTGQLGFVSQLVVWLPNWVQLWWWVQQNYLQIWNRSIWQKCLKVVQWFRAPKKNPVTFPQFSAEDTFLFVGGWICCRDFSDNWVSII